MKEPIEKPNYTQIPNVILDNMFEFTHTEFKVVMLVCRQTFGFHRDDKKMSFSYIEQGCGLSREAVNNAMITLLAKNILTRSEDGNSFRYALNVIEIGTPNELVSQTDQYAKQTDIGTPNELNSPKSVRQTDTKKERGLNKEKKEEEAPPLMMQIVEAWNKAAETSKIPKCLKLSRERKTSLAARIKDPFFLTNWQLAIQKIIASNFCQGTNDRQWTADFEWFITPAAVIKIIEGRYDNRTPVKQEYQQERYV